MKICILTHCFYPSRLRGGPTVSMVNMVKAIAHCGDVSVITIGNESGGRQYDCVQMGLNRLFGCDVYYLTENTPQAFYAMIAKVQPDVIYISSLFSWEYSIAALLYAKIHQTHVILAPRGELMPSALRIKAAQKKVFLCGLKVLGLMRHVELHVTARDEEQEAAKIFPDLKIWRISNIPNIAAMGTPRIKKESGRLRIAMIGRIHPIKNVDKALEMMEHISGRVDVDIYGSEEVADYVHKCKKLAQELPGNIQVRFCGVADHDQMSQVLQEHHILLSPTQSENFGQAIVEALLTGTPVIISNNTPWHKLAFCNAGWDIPLDQPEQFVQAIQTMVDMDAEEYEEKCTAAQKYIHNEIKMDNLIAEYECMLTGGK